MRVILGDQSVRLPDEYAMRLIEQGVAEPVADGGRADKTASAPEPAAKPNGRRSDAKRRGVSAYEPKDKG